HTSVFCILFLGFGWMERSSEKDQNLCHPEILLHISFGAVYHFASSISILEIYAWGLSILFI
ncbi:MAG: hypothetical protein KAR20_10555, partial [Candidatus Heimdallarchaeota archaeon]|nr:hypothetical protein [Candidatus Heimdallarchaeota archaeon]